MQGKSTSFPERKVALWFQAIGLILGVSAIAVSWPTLSGCDSRSYLIFSFGIASFFSAGSGYAALELGGKFPSIPWLNWLSDTSWTASLVGGFVIFIVTASTLLILAGNGYFPCPAPTTVSLLIRYNDPGNNRHWVSINDGLEINAPHKTEIAKALANPEEVLGRVFLSQDEKPGLVQLFSCVSVHGSKTYFHPSVEKCKDSYPYPAGWIYGPKATNPKASDRVTLYRCINPDPKTDNDLPRFSQPVITGDSRFRFGFGDTP